MKMKEEQKEWLRGELEKMNDWTALCRKCRTVITGSLADIRNHKCEVPHDSV